MYAGIVIFVLLSVLTLCYAKTYRIAWLAPGVTSGRPINSQSSVAALKLALNSVEANPMILSGHSIEIKYFDTDCSPHITMQVAMNAKKTYNPDVFIGPPCEEGMRVVAQLCTFWNLPVFTWYNPGIEFDGTQTYPTLIRMIPSLNTMSKSLLHVLRQNNWDQFVLVHDDSNPWLLHDDAIREETKNTEVQIWGSHGVNSSMSNEELRQLFLRIKKHSNIVVFACPDADIRRYMVVADTAGMSDGNFVFIQLDHEAHSENVLSSRILSAKRWKRGDVDDEAARRTYQSLVHVLLDPMDDDEIPTYALPRNRYREFAMMAASQVNNTKPGWELPAGDKPDVYSLYLYDTVLVWSVLVDKLRVAGKSERNGKEMAHEASILVADGATGFISLNEENDRIGKVFIMSLDTDGIFKPAEILKFNATNGYESIRIKPLNDQVTRLIGVRTNNPVIIQTTLPPALPQLPDHNPAPVPIHGPLSLVQSSEVPSQRSIEPGPIQLPSSDVSSSNILKLKRPSSDPIQHTESHEPSSNILKLKTPSAEPIQHPESHEPSSNILRLKRPSAESTQHQESHVQPLALPTTKRPRPPRPPRPPTVLPPTVGPPIVHQHVGPSTQSPDAVIQKLMARLQSLEHKIKEHESHSHQHIPDHTHTPHPLLKQITTPLPPTIHPHQNIESNIKANNDHHLSVKHESTPETIYVSLTNITYDHHLIHSVTDNPHLHHPTPRHTHVIGDHTHPWDTHGHHQTAQHQVQHHPVPHDQSPHHPHEQIPHDQASHQQGPSHDQTAHYPQQQLSHDQNLHHESPHHETPHGQIPHGETHNGQILHHQRSPSQTPYGEAPPSQVPHDQAPHEQIPHQQIVHHQPQNEQAQHRSLQQDHGHGHRTPTHQTHEQPVHQPHQHVAPKQHGRPRTILIIPPAARTPKTIPTTPAAVATPPPTTTTTTVPPAPVTQAIVQENGQISDHMIDRISSRLVDQLLGVPSNPQHSTNTSTTRQEKQIANDWLANNLDELSPGLLMLRLAQEQQNRAAAARQQQLQRLQQQRQTQILQQPVVQRNNEHIIIQPNTRTSEQGWMPYQDPLANILDPLAGIWDPYMPPPADYPLGPW